MKTASPKAHRNETTPWSTLGGLGGCGTPRSYRVPKREPAARRRRSKEFAEPVSLSSTALVDLPLARTALEFGFDLLALRARRKRQSRGRPGAIQEVAGGKGRSLRQSFYL